ncbi:sodium-coupled monocarboxylate transporter 1-like [Patiria miniata]|uniref:Sodium-coupled monocarboxylate transporter 1 n=1 Tax=Patiria miniata TaxID=46514 RepID=A0A913ZYN2_PATMI|nr:sodium-coupled monocarboxylate transporter 1-like [Patiria miniata]
MDSPSQPKFSWADYVVLGVVLAVSAVIGIFYAIRGRRKRTTNEFMVASRQMGFFPVALSLLASLFTGIYIQGMVSEVYFRGAMAPFGAIIPILVDGYISGKIFLPTFYKLRLRSVYQYLEMRFNKIVRNCCLFIGYLFMILHAGIATFAACLVLTTVSDMSFFVSVIVLSGVCTFYTALGGIKAVVWADAFQMILMYSPLIGAVVYASAKFGFPTVWDIGAEKGRLDIFNFSFDPTEYLSFWSVVVGGVFGWMPSLCILQYQVQRYNTCRDMKTAHMAMGMFLFGCEVVAILCTLAGLGVFALYGDCDPFSRDLIVFRDELLPYFAVASFSHVPGLAGLLVSGLCSAALSTVSSVINSVVTLTGEHVITKIWTEMPDSTYLVVTKLLAVFFGVLNIGMTYFMSSLGDILPTLIGLIGITSGPVMGVFILGFMFPRCNSKGALVGFFSGSSIGLWIFIGSLIFQKPPADLPLSTAGCQVELVTNGTTNSSDMYMTTSVDGLVTGTIEATGNLLLNTQGVFMNGSFGNTSEITGGFNTTAITPDDEYVFVLYRITRWWYPTITMCTVILVGLLTSLITGFNDFKKMDDILFVDWYSVFCWCRKNNQMEYELENEPAENEPAKDETENERKTWTVETEAEESVTSEPEEQQLPRVASPSNSSMTTKV